MRSGELSQFKGTYRRQYGAVQLLPESTPDELALPPHARHVGDVAHFVAEVSFDSDHVGDGTRRDPTRRAFQVPLLRWRYRSTSSLTVRGWPWSFVERTVSEHRHHLVGGAHTKGAQHQSFGLDRGSDLRVRWVCLG